MVQVSVSASDLQQLTSTPVMFSFMMSSSYSCYCLPYVSTTFAVFFCVWLQMSRRQWHWSAWNFARRYICVLDVSSPIWGELPQGIHKSKILGLDFGHLTANISKTVSRSIALHVNYSLTPAWRQLSRDTSPQGESIISKNVLHFWVFLQHHLW